MKPTTDEKNAIISAVFNTAKTGNVGIQKLYYRLKDRQITKKDIAAFLARQEVTQITRKNFVKARSFIPPKQLYEFQIDLIYIDDAELNGKNKYGLTAIDVFSKVADVVLLKSKNEKSVVAAMIQILDRMGTPEYVYSDRGSEFIAKGFKRLMDANGITQLFTIGHAPFIERFNRTFKQILHSYLISTNSKTITGVLDDILDNYNNSFHSVIGMSPNEVSKYNATQVYRNILRHATLTGEAPLKVGDKVRVTEKVRTLYTGLKKKGFAKGYHPKFSKIVHSISNIDGNKYYIDSHKDYYYRSQMRPVGEVETNPNPAQNVGSVEHRLKTLAEARHKLALQDAIEGKPVITKNMADYVRVTRSKATEPVKEIVKTIKKTKIEKPKTLAEKREQIMQQPVRVSTRERVANKKYV